jgi:hypothetical protein
MLSKFQLFLEDLTLFNYQTKIVSPTSRVVMNPAKITKIAGHWWLTPEILGTQEA